MRRKVSHRPNVSFNGAPSFIKTMDAGVYVRRKLMMRARPCVFLSILVSMVDGVVYIYLSTIRSSMGVPVREIPFMCL